MSKSIFAVITLRVMVGCLSVYTPANVDCHFVVITLRVMVGCLPVYTQANVDFHFLVDHGQWYEAINRLAQFREGEPPGEQFSKAARTEPRPPRITEAHLEYRHAASSVWPMFDNVFHRAIYLTGPTASGKTAVGVALAQRLGAEVIALDSMTLYRGMDIGTAKPAVAERGGILHHLIDVIDPWEAASVSAYRDWAREAATQVEERGKRALFVGGTALYLKALLRGLFKGPGGSVELRRRLEHDAEVHGDEVLHRRLADLDPAAAGRLHVHDRRRIIRALEVIELAGKPISVLQTEHDHPAPAEVRVFALDLPRAVLHERINRRVVKFFESGLIAEVRALQSGPEPLCPVAAQGIGYREVIAMLAGSATLEETIERVQARSRQFAKRQMTWFRGLEEVQLVPIGRDESPEGIAQRVLQLIERGRGN